MKSHYLASESFILRNVLSCREGTGACQLLFVCLNGSEHSKTQLNALKPLMHWDPLFAHPVSFS